MVYNDNAEVVEIDESAQTVLMANNINKEIETIRKQLKKSKEFSKSSYVSLFTWIKKLTASLLGFVGKGLVGAQVADTGVRVFKAKMIGSFINGKAMTPTKFVRNAVLFIVGCVMNVLSGKVDDSASNDLVKMAESVVDDLRKIRDKTDDDTTVEYIDTKIEMLENKIRSYYKEVKK